jgi:hypothetical protein
MIVSARTRSLAVRGRTSCSEACTLAVTGSLRISPATAGGKTLVLRLGAASKVLQANATGSLGVRISATNLARVRRALARGRRVSVLLSFVARDAAGNASARRSVSVMLRAARG